MLGRDVWKEPGYAFTNVIDVYINLLRRKIDTPGRRPLIVTVRGLGYTIKE
jgi:DNA-binding response OmpR family regulator